MNFFWYFFYNDKKWNLTLKWEFILDADSHYSSLSSNEWMIQKKSLKLDANN